MSEPVQAAQPRWYVLQTKPRQEFRALEQLQNQAYRCFLPTLQVKKKRRGKSETVVEPLFSRYLFIELDTVASNWAPLRSTRGVSNLVAFGGRLAMLDNAVVEQLRNAPPISASPIFAPGEKVEITAGPFAGIEGIYQMADGEARAMVLIELISQPQKILCEIDLLQKAA
jgi:transcriptional antiterminator RfaH